MADKWVEELGRFIEPLRVKPGAKVVLAKDFDPAYKAAGDQEERRRRIGCSGELSCCRSTRTRLYAQDTYGVLVCLQALDSAGKDGTIRHVMSGVNPQGVRVSSFKVPSAEELNHDYLWRYARRLPGRGEIAIFNRSHYEEVLVVQGAPGAAGAPEVTQGGSGKDIWARRYRQINDWERFLTENGIKVLKIFLNLSKEEQRVRFLRRVDLPDHNWKFSAADAKERSYLGRLPKGIFRKCFPIPAPNTPHGMWCQPIASGSPVSAPRPSWLTPSSGSTRATPGNGPKQHKELLEVKAILEAEAPKGAAPDPFQQEETARTGSPRAEDGQTSLTGYKSPNEVALLTAEERESTPSFMYVWRRWVFTVLRDRCSSDAMST